MVETKVKRMFNELGEPISIDRAHRIGKVKEDDRGNQTQPIIVRFPTFRKSTIVYRARKSLKEQYRYGISLDLTKNRLKLLNLARDMVKDVAEINFAYSYINCHLRVFTRNGKHVIVNSITDLESIISSL